MSFITGAKFDLTVTRAQRRRRRRWQPLALSFWDRLHHAIEAWRRDRHSRYELRRMTLRELRDIGITPAERDVECNRPFW